MGVRIQVEKIIFFSQLLIKSSKVDYKGSTNKMILNRINKIKRANRIKRIHLVHRINEINRLTRID